ncbi:flagellar basal body P-ring formation chaperone FlgA [Agaribacter flavus]|uniref:Flagellar basal body P-ring formation chaperone FlgA n=1 Tax=Agaribacter flavus TaxID=1902781 RepID=A0ABV7FMI5_9ALTE
MKTTFLILAFCLLLADWCRASEAQFKQPINRLTAPVLFSDVVTVDSEDLNELQWPHQLVGWIEQKDVESWLVTQKSRINNINWDGIAKVWVEICYPIKDSAFKPAVISELSAQLAQLHVSLLALEHKGLFCADSPNYSITLKSLKRMGVRHLNAEFLLTTTDQLSGKKRIVDVALKLTYMGSINSLSLNRDAEKYASLNCSDYSIEKRNWTGKELAVEALNTNYVFKKSLNRGSTILLSDIQLRNAVTQGQTIKVTVVNGPVVIEAKGKAMASANEGERIKVKVNGSKSLSDAVVVAKGEVHVSV